ncbi:hypothetical protein [Streptomyces nanshensis]|uniref:hypothetical protein n=1 Tax=Streptomyces nanshensis TaxID=518642 RepID=UPI00114CE711|nr:hypothetical protein [Streptomyces nanshensis]
MTWLDHMTAEDRSDFERVLDRALNSPKGQAALRGAGGPDIATRLRHRLLEDRDSILPAARQEYHHYRRLRARTASRVVPSGRISKGIEGDHSPSRGLLGAVGFLVPALSAVAAVVFLVFGHGLRFIDGRSSVANALVNVGWGAAAVAALATLTGLAGLLASARRNRSVGDTPHTDDRSAAVSTAQRAWHQALLEKGILPSLHAGLRDMECRDAASPVAPDASPGRAEADGHAKEQNAHTAESDPGFSSPDFSSPDFGSPASRPSRER